jgi:DNA repair exonuclease SbcCD ATPase subunit
MQIRKVKLKNIGPHVEFEVKLSAGLVGIVGANGSGKSTFVNAIYAALTNDFGRLGKTKSDVITIGSEGESSIELFGVHRGKKFRLLRSLRPGKCEFVFDGESLAKSSDVNEAIAKTLNISKTIIDKYVFVDQWEMFQFLSQTESERAKTFQYLCGTEFASNVHKICDAYATRQEGLEIVDNSSELETSLAGMTKTVQRYREQKKAAEALLLSDDEVKRLKGIARKHEKAAEAVIKLQALEGTKKRTKTERSTCIAAKESVEKQLQTTTDWLESNQEVVTAAKDLLARRDEISQVVAKRRSLKQQLESSQQTLDQIERSKPEMDESLFLGEEQKDEAINRKSEIMATVKQLARLLDNEDTDVCPCCGQAISEKCLTDAKRQVKKLNEELQPLEQQLDYSAQFAKKMSIFESKRTTAANQIAKLKSELQQLKLEKCGDDFDAQCSEADELLGLFKLTSKRKTLLQTEMTVVRERLGELNGQLEVLNSQIEEFEAAKLVDKALPSAERIEKLLNKHKQAAQDYAVAAACLKDAKQNRDDTQATLDQLKLRLAEKSKVREQLAAIREVAQVFHWNNLPKAVSQANLELLVTDVNENLALFNSPFVVEADQDLTFNVFFPGQSAVKARQLSGGQKVILAIAFRAALDRVFGHDVGMLFLDEPTAGLDADNMNYFHEAIQRLAQKVGTDRQLVVITHEHEFNESFDRLISITRE